jgi:hypothetical protein
VHAEAAANTALSARHKHISAARRLSVQSGESCQGLNKDFPLRHESRSKELGLPDSSRRAVPGRNQEEETAISQRYAIPCTAKATFPSVTFALAEKIGQDRSV